jgi:hypothetical protein
MPGMGKALLVSHHGVESSFGLAKLERSKLYGSRKRVVVDATGAPCTRAALTEDGRVVLRAGMTGQGYFDASGRQLEASELGAVDGAGEPLPLVPSTLGVAQPLEGPVSPRDLLDLSITSVYELSAEALDPALGAALAQGSLFRAPFNYRPDYRAETVYLVQNDAGLFALVGQPAPAPWLAPDAPPPADDAPADADELDFEMF